MANFLLTCPSCKLVWSHPSEGMDKCTYCQVPFALLSGDEQEQRAAQAREIVADIRATYFPGDAPDPIRRQFDAVLGLLSGESATAPSSLQPPWGVSRDE